MTTLFSPGVTDKHVSSKCRIYLLYDCNPSKTIQAVWKISVNDKYSSLN